MNHYLLRSLEAEYGNVYCGNVWACIMTKLSNFNVTLYCIYEIYCSTHDYNVEHIYILIYITLLYTQNIVDTNIF